MKYSWREAHPASESSAAGRNGVERAAERHFRWHESRIHVSPERFFAWLLIIQWLAGIAVALTVSPLTWSGRGSSVHLPVLTALFLGAVIVAFPVLLAFRQPGALLTRFVVAVGQMLFSALLIHLTGGRIESHFHVFGSLALLAFYRDWRVFVPAAAVIGLDHCVRGIYWPQSLFGVLTVSPWRWVEHLGWVAFELACLIPSCRGSVEEMRQIAKRQAQLTDAKRAEEARVRKRTAELSASEARFRSLSSSSPVGIVELADLGNCTFANQRLLSIEGPSKEADAGDLSRFIHVDDREGALREWRECDPSNEELIQEFRIAPPQSGEHRWVKLRATRIGSAALREDRFVATVEDITEAKRTLRRLSA